MAFCQIEDLTTSGECIIFPKTYEEYKELLYSDEPVFMEATIDIPEDEENDLPPDEDAPPREIKLICDKITLLTDACRSSKEPVYVELEEKNADKNRILELKSILEKHKGMVPVILYFKTDKAWCKLDISPQYYVQPGPELEHDIAVWMETAV